MMPAKYFRVMCCRFAVVVGMLRGTRRRRHFQDGRVVERISVSRRNLCGQSRGRGKRKLLKYMLKSPVFFGRKRNGVDWFSIDRELHFACPRVVALVLQFDE